MTSAPARSRTLGELVDALADATPGVLALTLPEERGDSGKKRNAVSQLGQKMPVLILTTAATVKDDSFQYDSQIRVMPTSATTYGRNISRFMSHLNHLPDRTTHRVGQSSG